MKNYDYKTSINTDFRISPRATPDPGISPHPKMESISSTQFNAFAKRWSMSITKGKDEQ